MDWLNGLGDTFIDCFQVVTPNNIGLDGTNFGSITPIQQRSPHY